MENYANEDFKNLIADVLVEAKAQGANAYEAALSSGSGLSVTVRLGEVETIEHNRDKGLGVTVYFGKRKGSASTTDFSSAALKETVAAACSIAKYTSEDDCSGLADAALMAKDIPDLDLYYPWELSAEQAIEIAKECEDTARSVDKRITNSEGSSISTQQGFRVYGNSHGFLGAYPSTRHSLSCTLIGQEGESMQRDYWYSTVRDSADLEGAAAIGKRAAERTLRRLNARRVATCRAPVVFSPEMAAGLLGSFVSAVRGGSLYRKTSFLLDSLGQQVFPSSIHIHEEPLLKKGLGSAPFDSEGVATGAHDLVHEGRVASYVLDSYSARKLGMQTTGNAGGVHNLVIDSGPNDLDGLLKKMDKGLLVTELMGQGINRVTGDYSRGASGFWIEGGQIQYPVEEITVAGNLKDMFLNIVEVGNDVDTRRNIRTGSILIENMTIAGE
jgi:PmbA protein